MGDSDQIIPLYLDQAARLLKKVENGLLELESQSQAEDAVHTVYRCAHTLKAGALVAGLDRCARLARRMEDVLNLLRNQDMEPEQTVIDALWQSLDALKEMIEGGGKESTAGVDGPMRALDAAISSCLESSTKAHLEQKGLCVQGSGLPDFTVSAYTLANRLSQGSLYYIHLDPGQIKNRRLTPLGLVEDMLSMGEILDCRLQSAPGGGPEARAVMHLLYFTVLDGAVLEAALGIKPDEYRRLSREDFEWPDDEDVSARESARDDSRPDKKAAPSKTAAARPVPPALSPSTPRPEPVPQAGLAPAPSADEEDIKEYLTFSLNRETYGVDILSVQEIMRMPRLTILPKEPPHVLGVMNLRGMVVPVVDLRLRLGLSVQPDQENVIMVVLVGSKVMGAVVDGVQDVVQLSEEDIQQTPDFAGPIDKKHLRGLGRIQDELVILLELDNLLLPDISSHAA